MGKLGDVAAILGLGIVGGVLYMFASGKWKLPKLPTLEDIFKLPTFEFPPFEFPPITFPPITPPWEWRITPPWEWFQPPPKEEELTYEEKIKLTLPPIVPKEIRPGLSEYEQMKLAMQVGPYPPIPPKAIPKMVVAGLSEYEKMKLAMVGRMAPSPAPLGVALTPAIPIRALQKGSMMERKMRGMML